MKRIHLVLALAFTLLLAACGNQAGVVTIRSEGMRFVPDEVRVRTGQDVTLRLVNRDSYPHAFDLDEFNIHVPLAARATLDVSFTPDQPGAYLFYCGAPGHTAAGMVGTLIVEP